MQKTKSNETLMKTTNLQLIQEVDSLKKQLDLYSMPTKFFANERKTPSLKTNNYSSMNIALNSARSAIEESIYSIKSKMDLPIT
jgi:hypothetical protein